MPFAVFRRHQRKLLAIFAILAMFGFVLGRLAPPLAQQRRPGGRQPRRRRPLRQAVRRSDLDEMPPQRNNANLFMAELPAGRPRTSSAATSPGPSWSTP